MKVAVLKKTILTYKYILDIFSIIYVQMLTKAATLIKIFVLRLMSIVLNAIKKLINKLQFKSLLYSPRLHLIKNTVKQYIAI